MKRFHVHVTVRDLAESVRFYVSVFGAEPTVRHDDYAKWMPEDPRINFAISTRGAQTGLNHLGVQVEGDGELRAMRARLATADARLVEQTDQACCYAKSDKYWVTDPQGIAWETFHTLASIPVFGDGTPAPSTGRACCTPPAPSAPMAAPIGKSCCAG